MSNRISRVDRELDQLIDECLDLRVRISLRTDEESPEIEAMINELSELQKRVAKRQVKMRNAQVMRDQMTA